MTNKNQKKINKHVGNYPDLNSMPKKFLLIDEPLIEQVQMKMINLQSIMILLKPKDIGILTKVYNIREMPKMIDLIPYIW